MEILNSSDTAYLLLAVVHQYLIVTLFINLPLQRLGHPSALPFLSVFKSLSPT
jgi:hypothetical protein